MNLPKVSVIITTKNEEKNIESCIKSVKNQTYPPEKIEIIVVDNNSTDRTKEIARKYTDKAFYTSLRAGVAVCFKYAIAEIIALIDSDNDNFK